MRFVNETEEDGYKTTNSATNETTANDLDFDYLNQGQEN